MSSDTAGRVPDHLTLDNGLRVAYHAVGGRKPTVIFLGGFKSDMSGTKASSLDRWARSEGWAYLRFDYTGHGASDGEFLDGTIGGWTAEALAVVDRLTEGPVILVGSSMGGWIAVLVALERSDRVAGLVGVAAAPDFTEDLIWTRLDVASRAQVMREGRLVEPSPYGDEPYVYTRELIEDGRGYLVLGGPIALGIPVRLLHGMADLDVPWTQSRRLLDRIESDDASLTLIKDGDHRLSAPQHLEMLRAEVGRLHDRLGA
ncbi:MAG: alpha/beta hydrolase [Alphaproteobacteria bacterium]